MSIDLATCPEEQRFMIAKGYCGAKTRNPMAKGEYCTQPAGHRTDHRGEGRCWLHGGRNVIKSGRYSGVKHERLDQLIAEMIEDDDPLNTSAEIAAARAHYYDFIERYQEWFAALLAWHESYTPGQPHARLMDSLGDFLSEFEAEHSARDLQQHRIYQVLKKWHIAYLNANPKPTILLDISDAVGHLDTITKMVERVKKLNMAHAISRKEFVRIMTEIGNIIDQTVTDDKVKRRLRDRMATLKLA